MAQCHVSAVGGYNDKDADWNHTKRGGSAKKTAGFRRRIRPHVQWRKPRHHHGHYQNDLQHHYKDNQSTPWCVAHVLKADELPNDEEDS
mmetsp:Transcript_122274/g.243401  ORF Transcript_122274/g.243401 Transcript_122274/m.243401 type:complete len:89 (+) Transcript_122274:300-566(+)